MDMCSTSDLVAVAERLLAADAWSETQQTLRMRIEDQMSLEPEYSIRYAALQRRLEDLSSKRSDFHEHQ
jgi:predicted nicotinamide N-methyase